MLTAKERRFITEYRLDGDGANAARRAGYAPKSAKVTASRLLEKPEIAAPIANREQERASHNIATADERDRILSAIARDTKSTNLERIKAIGELNKCSGRYSMKHEHLGVDPLIAAIRSDRPKHARR